MNFKRLLIACGFIAPTYLSAQDPQICDNNSNGLPIAEENRIVCDIKQEFQDFEGRTILDRTSGLVSKVSLQSQITFDLLPTEPENIIQFDKIEIPEQVVSGRVTLADGPNLDVKIGVQPTLTFTGSDICTLKPSGVSVTVTKFQSSLDDWLDNIIRGYFNEEQLLADTISDLQKQVLEFQKVACIEGSDGETVDQEWVNHDGLREKLIEKYFRYIKLSNEHLDEKGWLQDTYCDGLLFNSLRSVAGAQVDIAIAEDPNQPGKFYRNWRQDCYKNHLADQTNSSKSTISKDMLIGMMHWALSEGRSDLITNLLNYGKGRSVQGIPFAWVVGEGQVGRVEMSPGLIQNGYDIIEKLEGKKSPLGDVNFQVWSNCNGFPCHLQGLGALLRWRLDGSVSQQALTVLESIADREYNNAMHNAVYGRIAVSAPHMERAYQSLLNEAWFPADRLPSNRDRKDHYIFERDYMKNGSVNSSWLPKLEGPEKVYSGTDFLFASAIVLGVIDGGQQVKLDLAKEYIQSELSKNVDASELATIVEGSMDKISGGMNPVDLLEELRLQLAKDAILAIWPEVEDTRLAWVQSLLSQGLRVEEVKETLVYTAIEEIFTKYGATAGDDELESFKTVLGTIGLKETEKVIITHLVKEVFNEAIGQDPSDAQLEWGKNILIQGGKVLNLRAALLAVNVEKISDLDGTIIWEDHKFEDYQTSGFQVLVDSCSLASVNFNGILSLSIEKLEKTITPCQLSMKKDSQEISAEFFIMKRPNPNSRVVLAEKTSNLRLEKNLKAFENLDKETLELNESIAANGTLDVRPELVTNVTELQVRYVFDDDSSKGAEIFVLPPVEEAQ